MLRTKLLPVAIAAGVAIAACSSGESALESGVDDPVETAASTDPESGDTLEEPPNIVSPIPPFAFSS